MERPPRDPTARLVTPQTATRWALRGSLISLPALGCVMWGPDEPSPTEPSISMTMAFVVVGLATALLGLASRRHSEPAWAAPLMPFVKYTAFGLGFVWLAVELRPLQRVFGTVPLTSAQWLVASLLALGAPAALEIEKAVRRAR